MCSKTAAHFCSKSGLSQALGGEAEKDEAKDRRGVFLGLESGIGAELVGGVPETLFERGVISVLFGWSDANHVGCEFSVVLKPDSVENPPDD